MKKIILISILALCASCKKDEVTSQARGFDDNDCVGTIIIDRDDTKDCADRWIIWSDVDNEKIKVSCGGYSVNKYNLVCDNPSKVYWVKEVYMWTSRGSRYINDTMTYNLADGKTITLSNRK